MPEIKLVYEITVGQLVIIAGGMLTLWKVAPYVNTILIILAEHRMLVEDYADRNGLKTSQVADMAVARVRVRDNMKLRRRGTGGNGDES